MSFNTVINKLTRNRLILLVTLGILILIAIKFSVAAEQDKKETQYDSIFAMQKYIVNNDPDKQVFLGDMYYFGDGISTEKSYSKAFELYQKAAKQGNTEAQYNPGVMYYIGESVNQDYMQARKWFEKAANQNHARSQFNLGVIYEDGEGVRQDMTIAKEWFGKSCDNGNEEGCKSYQLLN